ncbi:MAG: response regulator, partial [Lachnospiraceae bacterium]|nr:response regulator [Lachnospiraceae bacterium]
DEDKDKLYLSFERLEEQRNRHIEGTGLGMSIVTRLLALMGSEIHVESEYGKGSEFFFYLKQGIGEKEPIGNYVERLKAKNEIRGERDLIYAPGARILVVDDNEMNLKVAKNLFKLCGIEPDMAFSGAEAIEIMGKKNYDIVFLDHMMPIMDGIETLHKLKEAGLIPKGTTMIALTANAVVGAKEMYINSGFDDYLSKPIELKSLVDMLSEYLLECTYEEIRRDDDGYDNAPYENIASDVSGNEDNNKEISSIEKLSQIGIDTEIGLSFCGDEEEFYFEMISDYVDSYDDKMSAISSYYESGDWSNYEVMVHALKSTSKTLGIMELSERAKSLEFAAKDENIDFIKENHKEIMAEYKSIVNRIKDAKVS